MRNLTLKIDPRHAEALTQMGDSMKRTRVAEFEVLVEAAWAKFSNGKPLPVPRGPSIQVHSGDIHEAQALTRQQARLVAQAANEVINIDQGATEDFRKKFVSLCAEAGIKTRALTDKEIDQFEQTKRLHDNNINPDDWE